ncbi:MAG: hypothetical protein ACRC20_13815 [Segniliparus sp.]|uniref:hypothetical protein n=1 Tax=Segniliparus sp. TaxID=2804064 RepID=UPI003F38E09F
MTAVIVAAAAGGLATAPAQADRAGVCAGLDGLWSDRSEFIQITGRAACELTPESSGSSLLQLQFEYPSDVADDPAASKQLATYISTRIKHYQGQIAGDQSEVAVGVTYEEQPAGTARTVVFTEAAFTKGSRQPVTQKLTQTFTLSSSSSPVVVVQPDNPAPVPPDGSALTSTTVQAPTATATPETTAPTSLTPPVATTPPGTTVPKPTAPAPTTGVTPFRPLAPAQR